MPDQLTRGDGRASAAAIRPASEVPGPRLPRLAQTLLGVMRPLDARLAMRRRYGGLFRSHDALAGELFHVAHRDLIEEVFKWKPAQYTVAEPRQVMAPVTGPSSILLLDGERHLRMRKLMLPPFHGDAIAHYAEQVAAVTEREIAAWRRGQTVRMREAAQAITMEVIIRAVFGITDADRVAELRRVLPRLSSPSPLLLLVQKDLGPRSPWGRFLRVRDQVDRLIYGEIERRRSAPDHEDHDDILTLLLAARDEDDRPLSDRELRDELITLLLAGHETTATSIGWAFERLLRTPRALERLTREVQAGESSDYLDAVVKETLRVRPVITRSSAPRARRPTSAGTRSRRGLSSPHRSCWYSSTRSCTRRIPRPFAPSVSSTARPSPTPGCRSEAAYAAASAPPSRPWR